MKDQGLQNKIVCTNSPSLPAENTFQDPQQMPETMGNIKLYVYCFLLSYVPFHLAEALHGFSLSCSDCQHRDDWALEPL